MYPARVTVRLIAGLAGVAWCAGISAQSAPSGAPAAQSSCSITLPYLATEQISDCAPQPAAAYDFAFCSVALVLGSLAVEKAEKLSGENGNSETLRNRSMVYAKISAALSDKDSLLRNIALAKKFYESLQGKDHLAGPAVDYVTQKCRNLEASHAGILMELIQKQQDQQSKEDR